MNDFGHGLDGYLLLKRATQSLHFGPIDVFLPFGSQNSDQPIVNFAHFHCGRLSARARSAMSAG